MKKDFQLIKVNKVMTMKQIEKKCRGHWVIIDKPERDEQTNTLRGKLLYYSKDKKKLYDKAIKLNLKDCDLYYIGPMKEDLAYIYKHIH